MAEKKKKNYKYNIFFTVVEIKKTKVINTIYFDSVALANGRKEMFYLMTHSFLIWLYGFN